MRKSSIALFLALIAAFSIVIVASALVVSENQFTWNAGTQAWELNNVTATHQYGNVLCVRVEPGFIDISCTPIGGDHYNCSIPGAAVASLPAPGFSTLLYEDIFACGNIGPLVYNEDPAGPQEPALIGTGPTAILLSRMSASTKVNWLPIALSLITVAGLGLFTVFHHKRQ